MMLLNEVTCFLSYFCWSLLYNQEKNCFMVIVNECILLYVHFRVV